MHRCFATAAFLLMVGAPISNYALGASSVDPATMRPIGTVDERFESYNIEMVEVTGGRFWKPYKDIDSLLKAQAPAKAPNNKDSAATPSGMDSNLFQQRPPIELRNARLRRLAAALGPAYVRVSGTWANSTYFHNSDEAPPLSPPKGFGAVLTRQEWKGVIDFARSADARLVTSFATSGGTRNAAGVWTTDQARQVLAYTKSIGGSIAAAEYMNEPTFAGMGGAPKGYDAAAYARDLAVFRPFVKQAAPEMILLGPGGVAEGTSLVPVGLAGTMVKSEDILKATGPVFDAFSYHSYGGASKRCGSGPGPQATADNALSEDVLSRPDRIEAYYAGLRDKFEPGKPLWLTETADAACGGNPWASTFVDSFRYLDQLGRLAKRGVQVHMHNTLAASDYGLIDDRTLLPRPNYWAALLWRNLMGTTVLEPGASPSPHLELYAHCLRGRPGGVTLLAINTDKEAAQTIELSTASDRYTLSARKLDDAVVQLNGSDLLLSADDALPRLAGVPAASGSVTFAPASITFLAMANARNSSCQ